MKHIPLKRKLYLTLALLCAVMLCSWGIFSLKTAQEMRDTNQSYIAQISDRVIDTMESTFLGLEHVAVALSISEDAKNLLLEQNPLLYHEKAGAVRDTLDSIYQPDGLMEEMLIYDMDGIYCRLRGELGNTAASRIQHLVDANSPSQHIVVTLEGYPYIGYITGIFEEDQQLGYLAFLMKGSRLRDLFLSYDENQSLYIGLVADGTVIAANDSEQIDVPVDAIVGDGQTASVRQVGLTPFRVLVSDNEQIVHRMMRSFFFAAMITILLLLAMLLLFYRFLNKLFFRPMLGLMENARQIGAGTGKDRLQLVGQEEFDQLVEQINSMVSRLDENNRTLFQLQYKMQSTEFEKQQAILISLKKQINAHFTVNTLNVVKRFNETGENEKAGIMCDGLSSLLRYANGADEFISCRDELYVLEQYVDIMKIRYPNRFTVEFDAEEELDDVMLPCMLVQPIVENAVSHGLLTAIDGRLTIYAGVEQDMLVFRIIDNGRGMTEDQLQRLQEKIRGAPGKPWGEMGLEHIALPNIQKRVVSMFGGAYGLKIVSAPKQGTTVTLTLPANQEGEEGS